MSAFLDETGTLITVDHSNPLPVALVAGFTSLNDGELKTASYANPLPVTIVTTNYTEAELPAADSVAAGTEVFNTTYQVKMRSNGTYWEWLGIGKSTWANKPAIATQGQIICITDIGNNGSLWRGNGTNWGRLHSIKFYDLSAAVSLTGTTVETTLLTINIPSGLIGTNGKVKMYPLYSMTNNANSKTLRVKLSGSTAFSTSVASSSQSSALVIIRNIGSESVQKSATTVVSGLGNNSATLTTLAIDTSVTTTIMVTGQLANSADTMTLEDFFMEIS